MKIFSEISGLISEETTIWEILFGIGNLVLAAVVIGITLYNNKRNRRIHIADKRKEWLREFRNKVSELTAILTEMRVRKIIATEPMKNALTQSQYSANRHLTLINEVMLLLFEDSDSKIHSSNMATLMTELKNIEAMEDINEVGKQNVIIMETSKEIIKSKWKKIKNLEK